MFKNIQRFLRGMRIAQPCNRSYHRLLLSKMFPYDELDFQKNVTNKNADDKDSTYEGSLSYALMMKHKLLHSSSSGSFSFNPSILRSQTKLQKIIDEEMHVIGAEKVGREANGSEGINALSVSKGLVGKVRWAVMSSELFKLDDRSGASFCLSPTHEEIITSMVASESPISYKRLPIKLYQIGSKFRDEKRPKHGLLRGREFVMKDLYTFDSSPEEAQKTFLEVCNAYRNIINWLDIPHISVHASSGSMGGSQSMEFHLKSPVGEDTLFTCKKCGNSYNKELMNANNEDKKCPHKRCHKEMNEFPGIEIAHAFVLETKYSDDFQARFIDQAGNKRSLVMGCYGIGVGRLLAASIEILSTPSSLRYPRLLAPHQVCIIPQKEGYKSEVTNGLAEQLYDRLTDLSNLTNEVVIDDRTHFSIGQRLKQASSIGYPYAVALGKKALNDEPLYEFVDIYNDESSLMSLRDLVIHLSTFPSIKI